MSSGFHLPVKILGEFRRRMLVLGAVITEDPSGFPDTACSFRSTSDVIPYSC